MSFRGYMLLGVGLVFGGALFSQAQQNRAGGKQPVDITASKSYFDKQLNARYGLDEGAMILVGEVAFHHNGAVISCDSAVRYSDRRIDCFKNVIINKDSTFVYGDRAEYNGDLNLARVYSPVIKVIDGDATLYTYNFSFNTQTNVGTWFGGGVMYQQDNTMESEKGYFYSDLHELVAVRDVEMKNDSHWISTDSVRYNTETEIATFYTRTYIWTKDGEMIRADKGRYHTQDSTYFFWDNAYVLDEFRETWADTIDFNARVEDLVMYGNIQIDDNEHESSAFGDFGQYWGERGETMLTKLPSLLNYNADQGNSDTLYMRADTVFMFVIYPSDGRTRDSLPAETPDPYAHLHWVDSLPDSVRLAMADSLKPVIERLRGEEGELRRRADSIMDALYPPAPDNYVELPGVDSLSSADSPALFDSLASGDTTPAVDSLLTPADSLPAVEENSRRSRRERRQDRRNSGPSPGYWLYPDADSYFGGGRHFGSQPPSDPPTDGIFDAGEVLDADAILDTDAVFDATADSLLEAQLLLDTLLLDTPAPLLFDDTEPVSDTIISSEQAVSETMIEAAEPAEPERPEPPEVTELRARAAEIKAEADSLQTAESYIRPDALSERIAAVADSLARIETDSLARVDSLARADSILRADPKAFKKWEKAERKRLKAEAREAKMAEKQRIREEKQRVRDEKRAAKAAAREAKREERRRLIAARRGWVTETPYSDSIARADSLARLDSLMPQLIDSLERIDSLPPPPAEPAAEPDTTMRIFRGWYNVKIWRKDMQGVCDSVVGFSRDSTVHMYTDPVLWYGQSQITADSITLITANEQVERAYFYGEPIMASQVEGRSFNQVKGETMTSWFRDSEIYRHDTDGSAQTLYYVQEEEKGEDGETVYTEPLGFLVMTASNISFLISNQYVDYIIPRDVVDWTIFPIEQIPPSQARELQDFEWKIERKPELADVFDRTVRPAERSVHEAMPLPAFPIAARIDRRREYLIDNRMWGDRQDPLPAYAYEWARTLQP